MKTEMSSRERIRCALSHQEADRIAVQDSIWATTVARWRKEGLPQNVSPDQFFDFEMIRIGPDRSLGLPTAVLEETDEYQVHQNANGRIVKDWKNQTSTPMLIDYTIKTRDDWEKHKNRLTPTPDRIDWDAFEAARQRIHQEGLFFCYTGGAGYQAITGVVHPDQLLELMILEPDWVKEMIDINTDMVIGLLQLLIDKGYQFDGYWCSDDLGYRNGLMFSPRHYRELVMPAHQKVCDFCHQHGLFGILHSCGNVNEAVGDLIEAGWDCLQPLEVKAQMDVIQLKQEYGDRLALMGGIDVRVMADGTEEELEEEIRSKLEIAKENGGYIYHSDHSVPDNVSFQRYQHVIELIHKYGRYE
jgi:uroporphyrinogen decarboxylase